MKIAGVVLCGGKSSRMGTAKAMLTIGNERMLQRVVRILHEVVEPIVVVAAPDQDLPALPVDISIARDERESRGPLEGISIGLKTLQGRAEAAYITACDVPLLRSAFVRRLSELLDDYDAVVPVDGEFHHPLAAVYRLACAPVANELVTQNRLRPVFLYEQVRTRRVPVQELRDIDPDLESLRNVNYPADFAAVKELILGRSESK